MSYSRLFRRVLPAIILAASLAGLPAAHASSKKSTTATPATTSTATTSTATTSTATTTASASTKTAKTSSSKLPADEQFSTVALAQAHCAGDSVVWSTLSKSKSFHASTSKYYGKTKHGAYVCQKDALAAGFHASKN